MSKTHFEECFERICAGVAQATEGKENPRTQVDMAELLGIRQSSVSDAKRRDSIPDGWLVPLQMRYDLNPRWILTGHSDMFTVPSAERGAVVMQGEIARMTEQAKEAARREILEHMTLADAKGMVLDLLPEGARVDVRFQQEWQKEVQA